MLGKLIKHECKAVGKILTILHIALVLMAIVGKILLSIDVLSEAWLLWQTLLFVYILSVGAVGVGTHIYLALRYYKNMYTDEGYLSFTLPVKPWEHLLAKTLVSSIWILIDAVAIGVSVLILVMYKGMGAEMLKAISGVIQALYNATGVIGVWEVIAMVLICLLSLICFPLTYYFSISVGQLFKTHKMLASVVMFFITTNVVQVISTVCTAFTLIGSDLDAIEYALNWQKRMINMGFVLQVVFAVVLWGVTNYIMNKKVNLE